jgi:hypothetical protein
MGRRSRQRGTPPAPGSQRPRPRARPPAAERPPAPWGSFPLSELIILAGIVVLIWGMVGGVGERVAGGLALASLGGGELALREHLGGFRSHSALLAGTATFVVVTVIVVALGPVKVWVATLAGVAVFGASFYWMRELFKRRSGGLHFRWARRASSVRRRRARERARPPIPTVRSLQPAPQPAPSADAP